MRLAVAIATVVLLLTAAVSPHVHAGPLGDHACLACVAAGAEEATGHTPDVAPRAIEPIDVVQVRSAAPPVGLPLGAIPGQSPPRA